MTAKNNSKDRETCWKARDFYFSCLAASFSPQDLYNSLKDGGTVSESDIIPKGLRSEECNKLKAEMYEKCPKSWVSQSHGHDCYYNYHRYFLLL